VRILMLRMTAKRDDQTQLSHWSTPASSHGLLGELRSGSELFFGMPEVNSLYEHAPVGRGSQVAGLQESQRQSGRSHFLKSQPSYQCLGHGSRVLSRDHREAWVSDFARIGAAKSGMESENES